MAASFCWHLALAVGILKPCSGQVCSTRVKLTLPKKAMTVGRITPATGAKPIAGASIAGNGVTPQPGC